MISGSKMSPRCSCVGCGVGFGGSLCFKAAVVCQECDPDPSAAAVDCQKFLLPKKTALTLPDTNRLVIIFDPLGHVSDRSQVVAKLQGCWSIPNSLCASQRPQTSATPTVTDWDECSQEFLILQGFCLVTSHHGHGHHRVESWFLVAHFPIFKQPVLDGKNKTRNKKLPRGGVQLNKKIARATKETVVAQTCVLSSSEAAVV